MVGAVLVAVWARNGAAFVGLLVLLFSWGIAATIEAWNVFGAPFSQDKIRRENGADEAAQHYAHAMANRR